MIKKLNSQIKSPKLPVGNYIVMILTCVVFIVQFTLDYRQQYLTGLILEKVTFSAILGHMWLHADILHFLCNLVFLWIFGHAVCLKIGNTNYPLAYIFVGFVSAVAHILYDGRPAIGASGAIFGILGMHLVLFFRYFSFAGPWIILIWFTTNLAMGITGYYPTAYFSHIGGFFAGIILAFFLVLFRAVEFDEKDETMLSLFPS